MIMLRIIITFITRLGRKKPDVNSDISEDLDIFFRLTEFFISIADFMTAFSILYLYYRLNSVMSLHNDHPEDVSLGLSSIKNILLNKKPSDISCCSIDDQTFIQSSLHVTVTQDNIESKPSPIKTQTPYKLNMNN